MNQPSYFLSFCFLLLLQMHLMGQEQWELVKEKDGIEIFTRTNTISSFKEFKATMEIQAGVNDFLSVLYDVEGLPDWGYSVKETKLLERPDDLSQIYYAVAKAPWPYKDRDGVYLNRMNWNIEAKELHVDIELLEQDIDMENGYVRMDGYGHWQVKEVKGGKLQIVFQMQMDPGGSIKAWMANMFVTDSPYHTMNGLRKIIQKKKYQDKTYEFLQN